MGLSSLYLSKAPLLFGGVENDPAKAVAIVVGVPYDASSSYRPGSRFAPSAIRSAAANIEFYSLRTGIDVDKYPIADAGDIAVTIQPQAMVNRVEGVLDELRSRYSSAYFVVLGGEHTITLGSYPALGGCDACLLVFDAHLDMRESFMGDKYSHACVMRRIAERCGTERMFIVGARAFTEEEYEYVRRSGVRIVDAYEARRLGPRGVLERVKAWARGAGCSKLYVSVDMDVYDPGYAPGVANPEPEGLTPWFVLDVLVEAPEVTGAEPVALDVVEVCPPYDPGSVTSILAAKTVVEAVASRIRWSKFHGRAGRGG